MEKMLGTVFNVSRVPKTAKRVNVGDFETIELAEKAMLEHYKALPKRGKFYYSISEDELEDFNGIVMRRMTLCISGGGPYYKKYTRDDLNRMTTQTC